jgi:hypothetical protein
MDPYIQEVSLQIVPTLIQNTASSVAARIQTAKAKKDDKQTIAELTEIINELVEDNSQLQGAVQAYKHELVAQQITREDISYITDTVIPLLEGIMATGDKPVPTETVNAIRALLSAETLNVMQLLGFNFKQAIGQPLTELVAGYISSISQQDAAATAKTQEKLVDFQFELIKIAQDEEAYGRYIGLIDAMKQV